VLDPAPARPAPPRSHRVARPGLLAVLTALGAVLALAACASDGPSSGAPGTAQSSPTPSPDPIVRVAAGATKVSYASPVRIDVDAGSFESVQVSAADGGDALDGDVSGDGGSWTSHDPPRPGSTYQVVASVKDDSGRVRTQEVTFVVTAVPDDRRISFTVTPDDGQTVGIGQPVVIRFATPVTERADVQKAMTIKARTPGGQSVTGSWHWLSGSEVHWRPKEFWQPGTTVHLVMDIAGVKASANRWGRKDYEETFTIGASHVTKVDAAAHRTQVFRDGKLVATWKSGTGRKGLETYSGTYIVLGKAKQVQMDSCSARITCDKKNPDYYDEKEYWATRITASGTFLHAASWDGQLGRANVSHGCVHLSDTNAQEFYDHAVVGDVVIVSRSGRGPQERIATQDPGLYDWNLSWSAYQAGSALR